MSYKNLTDMHIHSECSPDSVETMENICKYSIKRGLTAIAITDHCEPQDYKSRRFDKLVAQSNEQSSQAQLLYKDDIYVARGVEIGQPHHFTSISKEVLTSYTWDIVLGSLHETRKFTDMYSINYERSTHSPDYIMSHYFEEMVEMIEGNQFDVLAHMTYPLRYMATRHNIFVDLSLHASEIDDVLNSLVKNGKALEINVSSLSIGTLGEASPNQYIVNRFFELGGQYICTASDSHTVQSIGVNIDKAVDMAAQAGFKDITVYRNRKPVLIKIEKL